MLATTKTNIKRINIKQTDIKQASIAKDGDLIW